MAVNGVGSTSSSKDLPLVDKDKQGFNGMNSEMFMKLLITQLQNQDPLEPMDNDQLLNQISMMRSLQSNIELGDAMKSITTNQQLSTAAGFIGKKVVGTGADNAQVTGVADRAFIKDGAAYIAVGSKEMPLASVTAVSAS